MIRPVAIADVSAIIQLYNYYIQNSTATFEEQPVTTEQMADRIIDIQNANLPWYVYEENGQILGYAYASTWKPRSAYRYSVETSVYIRHDAVGKGLGRQLYDVLFDDITKRGIHTALSIITLPNDASVSLHEKIGMKKVAHLEQVGFKFGKWIDVGYWQKQLS